MQNVYFKLLMILVVDYKLISSRI